tara:strand:- start:72 stop:638 length:567 start_codon:yes stop_codon:yes gene_type:complete
MFPVPVCFEQLSLDLPEMEKYSQGLKKADKNPNINRSGDGWQSEPLVGEHPPFNALKNAIYKHAEEYRKAIGYKSPLEIKSIWTNINGYRDYNTQHTHPHAVVSGCFFIKVSKPEDPHGFLEFQHPSVDLLRAHWDLNLFNPNQVNNFQVSLHPTANQLMLFPSWIVHSVSQNLSKEDDRISISFNLS